MEKTNGEMGRVVSTGGGDHGASRDGILEWSCHEKTADFDHPEGSI